MIIRGLNRASHQGGNCNCQSQISHLKFPICIPVFQVKRAVILQNRPCAEAIEIPELPEFFVNFNEEALKLK